MSVIFNGLQFFTVIFNGLPVKYRRIDIFHLSTISSVDFSYHLSTLDALFL